MLEILAMNAVGARVVGFDHSRPLHSSVWRCLHTIRRILYVVRSPLTWLHWYTPDYKKHLKQLISTSEPAPKKTKTIISDEKVMAFIFLSRILTEIFASIPRRKVKKLEGLILPNYWTDSMLNCSKNGPNWRRKNHLSAMTHCHVQNGLGYELV